MISSPISDVRKHLVIIHGLWATGKSSLAAELSQTLSWPALSHDQFKEKLFEKAGIFAYFRCYNFKAYELLFQEIDTLLQHSNSVIAEAMFDSRYAAGSLEGLVKKCDARLVQIFLSADESIRRERGRQRVLAGRRHKMHRDSGVGLRQLLLLGGKRLNKDTSYSPNTHRYFSEPMSFDVECTTIRLNTNDFTSIDVKTLRRMILHP